MSAETTPLFSFRSMIALLIALSACFVGSTLGGLVTRPNLDWYATLAKPGFTPPNSAFPIVWTILYLTMAFSAWLVWRAPGKVSDHALALIWFAIQLVVGVVWSFAFFWLHSPLSGLIVVVALLATIVITIVLFDRLSRLASVLLLPYLLWVCFAAALNFTIWRLNS